MLAGILKLFLQSWEVLKIIQTEDIEHCPAIKEQFDTLLFLYLYL